MKNFLAQSIYRFGDRTNLFHDAHLHRSIPLHILLICSTGVSF